MVETMLSSSSSSFVSGSYEEKMRNKCICVYMMSEDTRVHELGVFPISDHGFKFQRKEEVDGFKFQEEVGILISDHKVKRSIKDFQAIKRRLICLRSAIPSSNDQVMITPSNCSCPSHDHEGDPDGMGKMNKVSSFYSPNVFDSGLTILGSTVYHFGPPIYPPDAKVAKDPFRSLTNAYKFDISGVSAAWNWEKIPPMNVSRHCPEAVVVDQEIYVFGGILLDPRITGDFLLIEKWAEVFDTSTQRWQLLPPPPKSACDLFSNDDSTIDLILAVLNHPKRILVGSPNTGDFCTYMVTERRWDDFEKLDTIKIRPYDYGFGQAAVFEQTLYLFTKDYYQLVAYDVPTKLWLRAPVHGLSESMYFGYICSDSIRLVHLCDNLFCLLWSSRDPVDTCKDTFRIHCAKVRVSKEGAGLSAFAESCQSYISDHYINFRAAWLMDGIFAE